MSFLNEGWLAGNDIELNELKTYKNSVYVYACVKKRSEKLGQLLNFKLQRGDSEVDDHWVLDVLRRPNDFQTMSEFFEMYQMYKDLTGSVFIWLQTNTKGEVEEMHFLRPDRTTVLVSDVDGTVIGYKYQGKNGETTKYGKDEVVASFYPDPTDITGGMGPLKPAELSVDTEKQLSNYHYSVLKNGGKVEGVISFDVERLSKTQKKEIKEDFEKHYSGSENSGKPLVLEGKADYKDLGLTPKELSFLDSKKMARDDILLAYQVPKTVLGLTEDVSRANGEEANRMFIADTIKPLIKNLVAKFNQTITPEEYELSFVDPTPKDVELALKKIENGTKNGYMTTNEKREMLGLEPLDDKNDEILAPANLINVNVGNPNQQEDE